MVYTITDGAGGGPFDDGMGNNGLPVIQPDGGNSLTINGFDAIIERDPTLFVADNTPCTGVGTKFRIIKIADGGNLILNDLTFRNGCSDSPDGMGGDYFGGGAILNVGGNLIINNSTITFNQVTPGSFPFAAGDYTGGQAISMGGDSNTSTTINDSIIHTNFRNNFQGDRGAIWVCPLPLPCSQPSLTIRRTTISNHSATVGAGLALEGDSIVIIEDSTLTNNNANFAHAAIFCQDCGSLNVINTTCSGNSAVLVGGCLGISVDNDPQDISFWNSTITNNTAPVGAGIYSQDDDQTVVFNNT
ncbi:MAG: hypothetical protein GWN56_00100, partial [Nitrosopumilaceae archaeon]|nr:hypothetical protein [Nitrosopumilaceae archaeon]